MKISRTQALQQKELNSWIVSFVRYMELFLKWTRRKLRQKKQRTRKLTTMHKAFNLKDDIDRIYVSRKKGGIGDGSDVSIQELELPSRLGL